MRAIIKKEGSPPPKDITPKNAVHRPEGMRINSPMANNAPLMKVQCGGGA